MYVEDYCEMINELLKKYDPIDARVVLWGAGSTCTLLVKYTRLLEFENLWIVDNRIDDMLLWGKKIMSPDCILWTDVDIVIDTRLLAWKSLKNFLSDKNFGGDIFCIYEEQEVEISHMCTREELIPPIDMKGILDRNEKYRDRHLGERIFIICTGPSINEMDLLPLKDEVTIAVSDFCLHKECLLISPNYYCIPTFEEVYDVNVDLACERLRRVRKATPTTEYFYSIHEKKFIDQIAEYDDAEVNYLYMQPIANYDQAEIDLTQKIWEPYSVSAMALEIAIYMGAKEIYLIGVEHDAIIKNDYRHFYCESDSINSIQSTKFTFSQMLYNTGELFKQFRALDKLAQKKNVHIYNATKGGAVDVFPRMKYEEVLKRK